MIDAWPFDNHTLVKAYNRRSRIYDRLVGPSELTYHLRALRQVVFSPGMHFLEVAIGPGRVAVEILQQMDSTAHYGGIDLSPAMVALSQQKIARIDFDNVELKLGDCRDLSWPDEHFDVVYSSYMMDLMPQSEIPTVLAEFKRVLKPGGQLVLVNMSKNGSR